MKEVIVYTINCMFRGQQYNSYTNFIILFKNKKYNVFFFFDLKPFFFAILFFVIFFICYKNDYQCFTLFSEILSHLIGKEIYENYSSKILWVIIFCAILGVIYIIFLMYKTKSKDEFINYIKVFLYQRINFIFNYIIFINLFKITTKLYFEYSFIIIMIFIIYVLIVLIMGIKRKEVKFKMHHFISIPLWTIIYRLWIFYWYTNEDKFVYWVYKFAVVGYDNKYYVIEIKKNFIKEDV